MIMGCSSSNEATEASSNANCPNDASVSIGELPASALTGNWRFCAQSSRVQGYLREGGSVTRIAVDGPTLLVTRITPDGGVADDDSTGGLPLFRGTYDPITRKFLGDAVTYRFYEDAGKAPDGARFYFIYVQQAVGFTFNAGGTRVQGSLNLPERDGAISGGREDGDFGCTVIQ